MGLEPASVSLCVRPFTLSNMNISETSWPIVIKFLQEHHKDGGLTTIKTRMGSEFGKIGPGNYELAALERLEKSP